MLALFYIPLCFSAPILAIGWSTQKSRRNFPAWCLVAFALEVVLIAAGGFAYMAIFGSDGGASYIHYNWLLILPAAASVIVVVFVLPLCLRPRPRFY